ncbi:helicase UvrD [Bacillus manliponensis]|uniref:DNA 3'-5' helicase n=1 Tax=Bacillus manliponensis TaxID=574376 RepID=A0A073JZS7_9BACI|nr:UvrD-helicase domain-containing protein [Bacillus manliponensis]KEK19781.1 helicase UvrD [Bacillus manliponensis]
MKVIYETELQKMQQTLRQMDVQLERLKNTPIYYGEDITEQALENQREINRKNLRIAVQEPYFGRLDFQEDAQTNITPIYIGKVGLSDEETMQPIVIDWRAPVASMFYSFTGGDDLAYYHSPDGLIEGDIHLKRNIAIRKRTLERVVDTYVKGNEDTSITDDFLLYRLGENKDNKLKDIVSTIQSEQNDIIRAEKNMPLIIQGVAGSGKTTVALHRLAFLIYQYREQLKAEKMIIFAPNSLFLDYISSVLPELGVGDIKQTTFQDWALRTLEDAVSLKDTTKQLQQAFSVERDEDSIMIRKQKGTISFQQFIKEQLDQFEETLLPTKDFEAWDHAVIKKKDIQHWIQTEYKHYPIAKRRERVIGRMKRWIEMELKKIEEANEKKVLKKEATKKLSTYMKYWPKTSALSFYMSLMKKESITSVLPSMLVQETIKNCRKKEVQLEDLAPLIYIHHQLEGIAPGQKFHHVVIDEAQDFSPFQIFILKEVTLSNSFTILGDLSQAIYDYQGIDSWNDFTQLFQHAGYYELTRSYRSTKEIIEFANEIIRTANIPVGLANPVFRSGEKVKVLSAEDQFTSIVQTLKDMQKRNVKTIAVVTRTEEACREMYERLQEKGISVHMIEANQSKYEGGISVVPVYLAKGLEFDAVLLADVDDIHYKGTAHDAQLLYVACTRSLHDLWVFYSGTCSPLIQTISEE